MAKKTKEKPKSKGKSKTKINPPKPPIDEGETELIQEDTGEKEENKKKTRAKAGNTKTEEHKVEFLPVWQEGEKTELPIDTVLKSVDFDINKTDPDHPTRFALVHKQDKVETVYYVKPDDFEKYIIAKHGLPKKLSEFNKQAEDDLQELKRAWIKFGTSILAVNTVRSYLLEYKTFEDYCEQKLQLNRGTVYEIMRSTTFLKQQQPKLYRKLMEGKEQNVPSYRSFYILDKKKKPLEDKGKFKELLQLVLGGKLSTRALLGEIKKIFHEEVALPSVLKKYAKACQELEEMIPEEHQDIIEKIHELLEELKELEK